LAPEAKKFKYIWLIAYEVYNLAGAYSGQIPANLDQTVVGELEKLVGYGIIAFRDQKGRPESAFDQPVG
jgi:hypothetical protein